MTIFSRFAQLVADLIGRPLAFVLAIVSVPVALIVGRYAFGSWDRSLLVTTTALSVLTWWQLFPLQHTQNLGDKAVQEKLNETVRAIPQADNEKVGLENRPEELDV